VWEGGKSPRTHLRLSEEEQAAIIQLDGSLAPRLSRVHMLEYINQVRHCNAGASASASRPRSATPLKSCRFSVTSAGLVLPATYTTLQSAPGRPFEIADLPVRRMMLQTDLASVYKAMDCFVLPTRGEGWGRPIAEAMSMALPVIGTLC
jgi:glycosyltransferase involved in cell wall biosynthesis